MSYAADPLVSCAFDALPELERAHRSVFPRNRELLGLLVSKLNRLDEC